MPGVAFRACAPILARGARSSTTLIALDACERLAQSVYPLRTTPADGDRSMQTAEPGAGLACIPSAIPLSKRAGHFMLARKLFTQLVRERTDLPTGFALRFAAEAFEDVARFVDNERKCCPFIAFEIALEPGGDALWLRMTGPEGTRDVLQAELDLGDGCHCC